MENCGRNGSLYVRQYLQGALLHCACPISEGLHVLKDCGPSSDQLVCCSQHLLSTLPIDAHIPYMAMTAINLYLGFMSQRISEFTARGVVTSATETAKSWVGVSNLEYGLSSFPSSSQGLLLQPPPHPLHWAHPPHLCLQAPGAAASVSCCSLAPFPLHPSAESRHHYSAIALCACSCLVQMLR